MSRGEQPGRNSLRTLVPVSVRTANHFNMTDNQVSAMLPLLPVDEADPVTAVAAGARSAHPGQSQRSTRRWQRGGFGGQKRPVRVLGVDDSLADAVAPTGRWPPLATNVPGPRGRQTLMGRRVLEVLPIPPIALQLRTGIAMVSYADSFIFGITADYDTAPDIEVLAAGIEDGVARLVDGQPAHVDASADKSRPPAGGSTAHQSPPARLVIIRSSNLRSRSLVGYRPVPWASP